MTIMSLESFENQQKRAARILQKLKREYPNAKIALKYKTPMQLLAAVILSAQATDAQVNKITAELFKKYKNVDNFADANLRIFTKEVSGVNFYKNKAKYIVGSARKIRADYGGKIPASIDELVKLPGVARKTANIVLWQVYRKAQGIAVDTHVMRVLQKLGLTHEKNPVKIEQDLMKLYPKKDWGTVEFYFQAYGRTASPARGKPDREDPLEGLY